VHEQHVAMKRFLSKHLYSHEQKLEMTARAQRIVQDLFAAYTEDVNRMPEDYAGAAARLEGAERARVIADYIAGMTDRYAIAAHQNIAA